MDITDGARRPALAAFALAAALSLAPHRAVAEPLAHEQALPLWPERPASAPADLKPYIIERSESLFRADRALMSIAEPSLTVFQPEHSNGTSLIVAPSGSYQRVVLDKEGIEVAARLLGRRASRRIAHRGI
jgi:hypothetical protein